jgi:hypothetical protein
MRISPKPVMLSMMRTSGPEAKSTPRKDEPSDEQYEKLPPEKSSADAVQMPEAFLLISMIGSPSDSSSRSSPCHSERVIRDPQPVEASHPAERRIMVRGKPLDV